MSLDPSTQPVEVGEPQAQAPLGSSISNVPQDASENVPDQPATTGSSNKRRRPSRAKIPPEIRRSASTPHMRGLTLTDNGALSPTSDKRRNKLGYHRTSVACSHCRRRKIRCLPAADDPQSRCSNCIRLKKECIFLPVEQQNPSELRTQSSSKADNTSGAPSASNPSSPQASIASNQDQVDGIGQYPPLSAHLSNEGFSLTPEVDGGLDSLQANDAQLRSPPFTYTMDQSRWGNTNLGGYPPILEDSISESPAPAYWAPPHSSILPVQQTSSTPNFTTPAALHSSPDLAYGYEHENQHWAVPHTRSMSISHIEGLHNDFNAQYPNGLSNFHSRPPPFAYPPSLDTNSSSHTTTSLQESVSGSTQTGAQTLHNYNFHPTWSTYPPPGPSNALGHGQDIYTSTWHTEPMPLGKVEEEHFLPVQHQGLGTFDSGHSKAG